MRVYSLLLIISILHPIYQTRFSLKTSMEDYKIRRKLTEDLFKGKQ